MNITNYLPTFSILLAPVVFSACNQKKPETSPNIVLIVADDLGWKDVGYMGSSYYETPNIDRLAGQGMIFTNAYAGAANCAPSRACLMSGLNTPRHGIYTVGNSIRGNAKTRRLIPVKNTTVLADDFVTLAESLKKAGYVTGTFGKWHLGRDPRTQGFDVNVGGGIWGHPGSYFAPYHHPDIQAPEGEYLTDRLTKEAMRFIETYKDTLFFLYLPYYAVHTPLQAKPLLKTYFKGKQGDECQGNATYAAMIANMDSCVGALLNRLNALDLSDQTLVFFTSDNGGVYNISCQDPLRGGKGTYYEGGIRVPLTVRWPGYIPAGSRSDVPVTNLDFYPTLLDVTGTKPEHQKLDGQNILKVLTDQQTLKNRPLFWHFPIYLEANKANSRAGRDPLFRTRPGTILRYGDWKLHHYYADDGYELYNLARDPGEKINLADQETDKLDEMKRMMNEWLKKTGAPVPVQPNPEFDPDFEKQRILIRTGKH